MRVSIRILSGGRAGQQLAFDSPARVTLGRRPGNDVQFDVNSDLDVSGQHAEIVLENDGAYYLRDLGSANGTFSGSARVERLRLTSSQQVALGPGKVRIQIDIQPVAPQPAVPQPVVPAPQHLAPQHPAPQHPAPQHPAPQHPAPRPPSQHPASGGGPASPASLQASAPVPSGSSAAGGPPSPGQAVAAQLGPERKVGARTVAMMIDSAIKQSADSSKGTVGKSTVFVRSMVNQAVSKSTRRFKVVAVLLALLLIGSIGGLLTLRYFERSQSKKSEGELRKQLATLMTRLKQGDSLSGDEKNSLVKKLKDLKAQLAATKVPMAAGKAIARKNRDAVFLIAYRRGMMVGGYCTAFAIRKRVLGTNAHCIVALETFKSKGSNSFVVMNRHPSRRYKIVRAIRHPSYHKPVYSISRDVGLLYVDRDLPTQVALASEPVLRDLEPGDLMYTYGFPGRLARVRSPEATLAQGIIGRVTKLNGDRGAFHQNLLIQHSAFTSGGTSGSPIFDQQGRVVAVNAGGYVESGTLRVMDPTTGQKKRLRVAKQLSGYNFGIRIDVLRKLLARQ